MGKRSDEKGSSKYIDLLSIRIAPERQRSSLAGIAELAASIQRTGLLHAIVVRRIGKGPDALYELVAGERRYRAHELLQLQGHKEFGVVRCHDLAEISEQDAKLAELEENVKRQDLHWMDHARAMKRLVSLHQSLDETLTLTKVAAEIGYDRSWLHDVLKVADALAADNPRVKAAASLQAAINVIERDSARKLDNAFNGMMEDLDKAEIVAKEPVQVEGSGSPAEVRYENGEAAPLPAPTLRMASQLDAVTPADFITWSDSYTGPKFNLLHCDFPYGVGHGNSAQGGSKTYGAYDDKPEVYWELCAALCRNREKLLLRSCHIMFWFSMKWFQETKDFFAKNAPDLEVQDFPLIWLKTDNKGIVPDVEREPRRIYETAFLISRGDRKIIQAVANGYPAPTNKSDAIHISEKPVPVLKHFFRMFVDEHSRVLDPTAGGGSAIVVAEDMGAEAVVGLELNPEYAAAANKRIRIARNLRELNRKVEDKE